MLGDFKQPAQIVKENRITHLIIAIVALLLAFGLRIDNLGEMPVRFDEAFSVWLSNMEFANFTERTASDIHPPLYYWFFHLWTRLAGTSEFAIRAIAVFFSLITAAAVYVFTHRMSQNRLAASLTLLLITLSPFHIQWSQDARMYAQVTMFASLALYAYLRMFCLCDRGAHCGQQVNCSARARQSFSLLPSGSCRGGALLAIAGIGVTLTHYFGGIIVIIITIHCLFHWRQFRSGRRQFAIAIGIIAAAFLLWAAYAIGLIRRDPGYASFQPVYTFWLMATLFAVNKSIHIGKYLPASLLVSAILFVGIVLTWCHRRRDAILILLGCLLPPASIAVAALPFFPFHIHSLSERYFVICAPFVFAGWGISLAAMLQRRRLRLIGLAATAGLLILNAHLAGEQRDARYFKDDYRSMMETIAALTTSDEKVFVFSARFALQVFYYLDQAGYDAPKDANARYINVTGVPVGYVDDWPAMMGRAFSGFPRFWLIEIEAANDDPLGKRIKWIEDHYFRIFRIPIGRNGISLYSIDPTDQIPESAAIIPPVVTEARPGDQVRIGVPAGAKVDLVHSGQVIDTRLSDTWMLHQFDIYPFYFNGLYELRVADESYPFVITHSQDFPGDV